MVITQNNSFISSNLSSYLLISRRNERKFRPQFSKKPDFSTDEKYLKQSNKEDPIIFPLRAPKVFLAQTAVAVLGLGFIDAGYSGDWSRIGVISKDNEELLKIATFVVVPLCLYLIFSLPKQEHEKDA